MLASIDEQGKLTDDLTAALLRPTPSPGSRTSTCPTSPSGGPRRRSPGKRAWNRWPTGCWPIPTLIPEDGRGDVRRRGRRRRCRRARREPGTSSSSGQPRTPNWSAQSGRSSGRTGRCAPSPWSEDVRQERCSAEVPRLLRLLRIAGEDAVAPGARRACAGRRNRFSALTFDGGEGDEVYQAMVAQHARRRPVLERARRRRGWRPPCGSRGASS